MRQMEEEPGGGQIDRRMGYWGSPGRRIFMNYRKGQSCQILQ